MGLFLALAILLAGTGVVLHERAKEGTAAPPLLLPSGFEGLVKDHLYRIWAKIDRGYGATLPFDALTDDLRAKVHALGFSEVLLATEDPTDPSVWSFLARWGQDASSGVNMPPLHVYTVQPVDKLPDNLPPTSMILDDGLSPAEAHAVAIALDRETEPTRLDAFSSVMIDDFPLAGVLLKARADVLRSRAAP